MMRMAVVVVAIAIALARAAGSFAIRTTAVKVIGAVEVDWLALTS